MQVGITVVGIFAGAYSGATLAGPLADLLRTIPAVSAAADDLALGLVVVAIAYLSLIAGELVPKRIALSNAETIAAFVASPMTILAKIGTPIVWFLRASTEAVLRLLRIQPKPDSTVSEEEVKSMIAEGTDAGVFLPAEREMIESVLSIADRSVRSIMVPRHDVIWLEVSNSADAILDEVRDSAIRDFLSAAATSTRLSASSMRRSCWSSCDEPARSTSAGRSAGLCSGNDADPQAHRPF